MRNARLALTSATVFGLATLAVGGAARAAVCGASFGFTGALDTCTIAVAGLYDITAFGAQGGERTPVLGLAGFGGLGGAGAEAGGDLVLSAGCTLTILVGGAGGSVGIGQGIAGGGGGGGSFVVGSGNAPLVVGGGGGGGGGFDASENMVSGNGGGGAAAAGAGGGLGNAGDGGTGGAGGSGFGRLRRRQR